MIDREPRRSGAPDDQQALPHRGGTRRTEDPGRCSDAPSSPVSDAKYRQKTESVFAKTFKSLLQQNRSLADKPSRAKIHRCPLLSNNGQNIAVPRLSAKCHVWTAPSWQELSSRMQHWSVQPCVRPLKCGTRGRWP